MLVTPDLDASTAAAATAAPPLSLLYSGLLPTAPLLGYAVWSGCQAMESCAVSVHLVARHLELVGHVDV
jgi:hypothetical protein